MTKDKFGQFVFDESDVLDLIMSKKNIKLDNIFVPTDFLQEVNTYLETVPKIKLYEPTDMDQSSFDKEQQNTWHMPQSFKNIDIAAVVLNLCNNEQELQRCGQELLLYQERNLFDLLKYLNYLTQTMKNNNIIWGVGRGSSVSSFVLYKLGVHRVNSLFYELDIHEFLR